MERVKTQITEAKNKKETDWQRERENRHKGRKKERSREKERTRQTLAQKVG